MSKTITIVILILAGLIAATPSYAKGTFHQILTVLVENDLLDDRLNSNKKLGQEFCKNFGGTNCGFVTSFAQGICYAAGGSSCAFVTNIGQGICYTGKGWSCPFVTNIGEGICYAGGGSLCAYVTNIGQGICYAGGGWSCPYITNIEDGYKEYLDNIKDTKWSWDSFFDEDNNLIWRCRGEKTGRFADNYKCSDQAKNDDTWPDK